MTNAESSKNNSVVVIGGGIGGLTAGALLARQGKRVALLEASDRLGGYQCRIEKNGFSIEPHFHFLQDVSPGKPVAALLQILGITLDLVRVDPIAQFTFPDRTVTFPNDRAAFIATLKSDFPGEVQGITKLFAAMSDFYAAIKKLPEPSPLFVQYGADSIGDFLSRFISDPKLKTIVGAWAAYFGYGTSHIAALAIVTFTEACWDGGVFHPRGGITALVAALRDCIESHGGSVRLGSKVARINIDQQQVHGVTLDDGAVFAADSIISNVDAMTTLRDLAGIENVGAECIGQLQKLERFRSPFCVYLGVNAAGLELSGIAAVQVVYPSYDSDVMDRAQLAGDIEHAPLPFGIATRSNPQLAPPGHEILILYTFIPNNAIDALLDDESRALAYARRLVKQAERAIPGLTDRVVLMETSASLTPALYTTNTKGALGWAPDAQTLPQMPPHHTPVKGLYLAGQWTQMGGGMNNVIRSASIAASLAMSS